MLGVKGTFNFWLLLVTKKNQKDCAPFKPDVYHTSNLYFFSSTCKYFLLSYFEPDNMPNSDQSEQEEEGNVFEVEEIIQVVIPDHGKPLYEIKWKGYSSEW